MNSPRVIRELEAVGRFLDMAYLPRTASAVRKLTAIDLKTRDPNDWFAPVLAIYRDEILGSLNILGEPDPEHHRTLLEGMDRLVKGASANPQIFSHFLTKTKPVLEAIGESHDNTRELYRSFVTLESSHKHTYLNLCLMYLILCEGVFANVGRLLIGLHSISSNALTQQAFEGGNVSPGALAGKLREVGLSSFAAGYHRNLRNAIAHGHIRYNSNSREMRFRDYNYRGGIKLVFDEVWTLDKFTRQYAKLDDVYLLVSTYFQVYFLPLLPGSEPPPDTPVH